MKIEFKSRPYSRITEGSLVSLSANGDIGVVTDTSQAGHLVVLNLTSLKANRHGASSYVECWSVSTINLYGGSVTITND